MSLRAGEKKERRFGEQQTGEIEGLELLEKWKEEERRKRRIEKGLPSDAEDDEVDEAEDDAAWERWNIEEDEDSDDSGGWIDVESDAEIELSDSDDDESPPAKKAKQGDEEEGKAKSETAKPETKKTNLATTRILTPADLAKLAELRSEAAVNSLLPKRLRSDQKNGPSRHADDPLTAAEIEGLAALSAGKATREERIAHAKEGKDRSEYKSVTARRKERKEAQGKSTTNKEKARRKNLFMTLGKAKSKNKRSLVETRNILRAHQQRQKRGGRRGNTGS